MKALADIPGPNSISSGMLLSDQILSRTGFFFSLFYPSILVHLLIVWIVDFFMIPNSVKNNMTVFLLFIDNNDTSCSSIKKME